MSRVRESAIAEAVVAWLTTLGYDPYRELPMLGRHVDVFAVHPERQRTIAVECKERDWRKAVWQAMVCQLLADDVYIALPPYTATNQAYDVIRRAGLGVLLVNQYGRCWPALIPNPSRRPDTRLSNSASERFRHLKQPITEGSYCG